MMSGEQTPANLWRTCDSEEPGFYPEGEVILLREFYKDKWQSRVYVFKKIIAS